MLLLLGNANPQDVFTDAEGNETRVDLPGPAVTYVAVNDQDEGRSVGIDRLDGESDEAFAARDAAHAASEARPSHATFPAQHDDSLLNDELAAALGSIPEGPGKKAARRLLINAHLVSRDDGVTHLPNHSILVALAHPRQGSWGRVSKPGTKPTWVSCPDHPGLEKFLGEYWDCPVGVPSNVEDTHYTQAGGVYPPGAAPDPASGIVAMKTSWGDDNQALVEFGYNLSAFPGANGTATAVAAGSLTGGTETASFSHTANDSAGMIITILSAADQGKYAFVISNTSGTSPVYTVDRWYSPGGPFAAAAATPANTSAYALTQGGAPAQYIAVSTNATAPSRGGTDGTQDASAASIALTSEVTTASGGFLRKGWTTLTHVAAAATVVHTTTQTANASDVGSLPYVIAKAALCSSIVSGGKMLTYMTAVSPTATIAANGDQLTTTWTFTMTNT